jgi:hypothetical protein
MINSTHNMGLLSKVGTTGCLVWQETYFQSLWSPHSFKDPGFATALAPTVFSPTTSNRYSMCVVLDAKVDHDIYVLIVTEHTYDHVQAPLLCLSVEECPNTPVEAPVLPQPCEYTECRYLCCRLGPESLCRSPGSRQGWHNPYSDQVFLTTVWM